MEELTGSRPQLAVAGSVQEGIHVIALTGELDVNSVGELDAAIAAGSASAGARVCLDLSGLGFIDSSGLAAVIRAHVGVLETGGAFAVVTGAGQVHRTLETTGLMEMLNVVGDRATALADLT